MSKYDEKLCSCGFPQSFPIPHEHDQTKREKQIISYYKILIEQGKPKITKILLENLAKYLKFLVDYTIENKLDYPMELAIANTKDFLRKLDLEVSD